MRYVRVMVYNCVSVLVESCCQMCFRSSESDGVCNALAKRTCRLGHKSRFHTLTGLFDASMMRHAKTKPVVTSIPSVSKFSG